MGLSIPFQKRFKHIYCLLQKKMPYKVIIILILFSYIFTDSFINFFIENDSKYNISSQEEIYIDKNEIDVFNRKSLDDITIIDKKVNAWLITVKYNKENYNETRDKLLNSGYSFENNKNKKYFIIGPFAALSQAREESTKMKKIYDIENTISSFVF